MLTKLALPHDAESDDAVQENSETRMLRALEALSAQPPPLDAPQPALPPPRDLPFRGKPGPARDNFRAEPAFSAMPSHAGNKARHRFVKDGEVPVVHMSTPRTREAAATPRHDPEIARLQQMLAEQQARAAEAERTLKDALYQLEKLNTKLAHTELALSDALALAQTRLEAVQGLQESLARATADAALRRGPGRPRREPAVPGEDAGGEDSGDGAAWGEASGAGAGDGFALPVKRKRGRPRRDAPRTEDPALPADPEPVQWWLLPAKGKRRS